MLRAASLMLASAVLVTSQAAGAQPTEGSLRKADAEQLRIILEEDAKAQQDFMHPNYLVNAPANRVLRKEQVVAMLAKGDIASDTFQRTVGGTAITGSVGIVMGNETVTPAPNSELGQLHPGKTLRRRFTNVFLWENGRWLFLARHASVVGTN